MPKGGNDDMSQPAVPEVRVTPLPWNALERGMTVVGTADSLWDVQEADTKRVVMKGRATGRVIEVDPKTVQKKGDARLLRGPELSRIMRARIDNAESILREKLGAVRADLGLNDGKRQGMVCSDVFKNGEDLASHLFIMHGEYARQGVKDVDSPEHRQDMWEFHNDLHADVKPIDSPSMVPHVHDVSQRGKGMRHLTEEGAEK
jgi:hypothetical protein